ncbi:hypothetical protein EDD18DRAFT_1170176 [Armillaria luteobubalina]|uniref:HMG box domain-containing protein n=1 Tax=Armillaria luteobubalina TaxID=153913 RepID=A0AA39UNI7_9AGAR|nr:hypothetical protein EDD18DRAFT_1170176 [Armillaria luteobubalina]
MLSALRARLGARLPSFSRLAAFTRQSTISSVARPIISAHSRTIFTSQRLEFPAKAATTKKVPAKKATAKKVTATTPRPRQRLGLPRRNPPKNPPPRRGRSRPKRRLLSPSPNRRRIKITAEMKPPKRSLTSYMTFHTEREAQAAVKSSAAAWKTLSEEQKQPYVDSANAARQEYEKAMKQWFLTMSPQVRKELNKVRLAKGRSRIAKPSWLEKQPNNAYMRFVIEFKEGKDLPPAEALKQAKVAWANLPEATREEYKSTAKKEIAAFKAKQMASI